MTIAARIVSAFAIGLLFGTGILLAGMSDPAKVLYFFDIAGTWDPSLAFVMGGALAVTGIGYRRVFLRERPALDTTFQLPTATRIDASLLWGAAVFGIGWGIAGFCPGGLVPVLAIGRPEPLVFFAALVIGIVAARWVRARGVLSRSAPSPAT